MLKSHPLYPIFSLPIFLSKTHLKIMSRACLPRPRSGPGPVGRDGDEISVYLKQKRENQMLKQHQYDSRLLLLWLVIPNVFRDLISWF